MTARLRVTDPAPDFTLPGSAGDPVSLHQFRGKSAVVLYFYPRDNTPVCSTQACSLRDQYEAFRDAGAEVIGVSADSVESHRRFAAKHQLPFHLLSDVDNALRARYGVPWTLWLIPGRVTFLIDKQGIIRHICSSPFQMSKHVDEVLQALHELQGQT
jgi:thioredoxin-dependent peroxiredoxin